MMRKNNKNPALSFIVSVALAAMAATQVPVASAATLQIINTNDPGIGFNESTAVTPVGGNTGTTIGQQRLIAFKYAADIWGRYLYSNTPIKIGAKFTPLTCSTSVGILGSAGPTVTYRNFNGAPYPSTYYPVALANALYGADLLQETSYQYHIEANFSSTIGKPGCMENSGWYYGLDGSPPQGKFDLVSVILHELGHGLGFLSLANLITGQKSNGYDDAYIRNLERHGATPSAYTAMDDAQRSAANAAGPDLHWIGANVKTATSILSAGKNGDHAIMYAPSPKEEGSSVSHWDKSMTPNQMMEPVYTGPIHTPGLELALFKDIGWKINYTLNASKNGSGTISSSPSGINCGGTCSSSYASGTLVNLYATPASGYTFSGWSGNCSGTGACAVTMDDNKSVTASFAVDTSRVVSIGKIGTGDGTVTRTSGSLNCGSTCAETMTQGTTVSLSATAAAGSTFAGWSGGICSGTGSCAFTLNLNTTVNAAFNSASGGETTTPLIETDLLGAAGTNLYYSVNIPNNAKNLVIRTGGGTGDANLYVKYAQQPTLNSYDCASSKIGNDEVCTFSKPTAGTYHIMLRAHKEFSGVTLAVSYQKTVDLTPVILFLLD